MADSRCPMCGKLNPQEAIACAFCGARLKPMRAGESNLPGSAPPPKSGPEDADWMSDLRGDMMRNRPKTSMLPPEPPAPAPSDVCLKNIDSRGESKPSAAPPAGSGSLRRSVPPVSPPKTEAPARAAPKPQAPPPQESAPETPTWLSKVRAQVSMDRQSPPPEPEKSDEDPAWLKRLRVRRTQDELAAPSQPAPESEPLAPGDLPDWLSKVREKTAEEGGQAEGGKVPSSAAPSAGEVPGVGPTFESPWGQPAPAQKPRATGPVEPVGGEPAVPDWMKYPSSASGVEPPVGTPDWLGTMSSALEETPPTPPATGPKAPSRAAGPSARPSTSRLLSGMEPTKSVSGRGTGRMPPSGTRNIPSPAHPFTEPPTTPAAAFGPGWEFPVGGTPDFPFPNPAADVSAPSGTAAFHGGAEPFVAPGGEEEVPDWLAATQQEAAATAAESEPEPEIQTPDINELLNPDAMPEWMHKPAEAGTEKKGGAAAPAPALPENLEQAELPRWLEAMRPIQSVAVPTEDEERVESVGPLAGLRGVLSAEPVVAMPRRPGIMAGNIDALPAHVSLTETLRRLLIEPEVRAARRPVRAMLLTPLIRKVMSAVLILAISLPIVTGSMFSQSVYQPEANKQAGNWVNDLQAGSIVLVAFEYDASSAAEIETGATVLLEHLAQRGVQVVFISSQPNGTMLGEGLSKLNEGKGKAMPRVIADFGYIPGGSSGLRQLGGDLKETIHRTGLDWDVSLASIRKIGDFSMILILAAKPQSIRDWVEQVHTAAPETPMIAVVSAASDALVFPYTQGSKRALEGLVTGNIGAQAYRYHFLSATVPSAGIDALRWQAFASGTLAILITLSVGIVFSLVLGFLRKDRRAAE
jgi:hypothetical protein